MKQIRRQLKNMPPKHETLVGIDSDGCVFDTMEVKQKQFFHPRIISSWHLEPVAPAVMACAEFATLHSSARGMNRIPALLKIFDLLTEHPDVKARGFPVPELPELRRFLAGDTPPSNRALAEEIEKTGSRELQQVLDWSESINRALKAELPPVPPFPGAPETLEQMHRMSDTIVVSQTPIETITYEWKHHRLDPFVRIISGQEIGSKSEQITLAASGRYSPDRILLLGDAPGDLAAARACGIRFFPMIPGREPACWARLRHEIYPLFLQGAYSDELMESWIADFEAALPENPPWA